MKSGTSCFNKAVYRKNLTLYWPVWVCYLLYGLWKIPVRLWMELRQNSGGGHDALTVLIPCLNLDTDLYVVAAAAVACGMTMFGYLFSVKSANMIHAMPVTRSGLYVTNIISGLTCIWGPQLFVFLVSVIFCLCHGITCVQYLAMWLFSVMSAGFFFYGLTCFCGMLTGLVLAVPAGFVIFNYLSVGLQRGVREVLIFLGYGLQYYDMKKTSVVYILSPLLFMTDNVGFYAHYVVGKNGEMVISQASFVGISGLIGYMLVGVLLYLLGWYGYRKRKIEKTGDLFTFGWIKPLFRWGAGGAAGYIAGLVIASFFGEDTVSRFKPILFVLVLVLGIVGYFIAEMLVEKSFRVFRRRRLLEGGIFTAALGTSFVLMCGVAYVDEQYIPDSSRIAQAFVNMNYPVEFDGSDAAEVTELQKKILENKQTFLDRCSDRNKRTSLQLTYVMKNGTVITRSYLVPSGDDSSRWLAERVFSIESQPDHFMKYAAGIDYDKIKRIREAQIECKTPRGNATTIGLEDAAAGKLYQAAYEDVKEGNLPKYNLENYIEDSAGTSARYSYAYLTIDFDHLTADWKDVFSKFTELTLSDQEISDTYESAPDSSGSLYLRFGSDCRNIMRVLMEEGLIESETEDIFLKDGEGTLG